MAYSTQQKFNDMLKSVGFRVSVSDQYWTDKLGDVYAKGSDVKIATDMVLNPKLIITTFEFVNFVDYP